MGKGICPFVPNPYYLSSIGPILWKERANSQKSFSEAIHILQCAPPHTHIREREEKGEIPAAKLRVVANQTCMELHSPQVQGVLSHNSVSITINSQVIFVLINW